MDFRLNWPNFESGTAVPQSKTWPSFRILLTRLRFGVRRRSAAFQIIEFLITHESVHLLTRNGQE
jgi:predicted metal-dependent hydrolase